MVELALLSALGLLSLFTGLIALGNKDMFIGLVLFFALLLGFVLLIMIYLRRRNLNKALKVVYIGYETYLYYLSYLTILLSCLLLFNEVIEVSSIMSPIVIVIWLVPLFTFLKYDSLLVFNNKYLIINGEKIEYQHIRKAIINDDSKICKIIIRAKGKEYLYKTNIKHQQMIIKLLKDNCHRIDIVGE